MMVLLATSPFLAPGAHGERLTENSSIKDVRTMAIIPLLAVPPLAALGLMSVYWRGNIAGGILSAILAAFCVLLMSAPKWYLFLEIKKKQR
ncbi:hypothetical protein KGD83_07840 [Nocardiopsis akebiae]|uniref:Uncharacterized protein n=1 Tax=Nocardiopsis akebiae TaxID=2831968 RepID=A0ABX8C7L3_9ACTN|nr:hypothetical protein [Nocardiopsis akebiae]QUX30424.1 hypothetical protein KGD83_07840 [Nocardiopsis akebiae]